LADTAQYNVNFEAQPLNGPMDFQAQVGQMMATDIFQFDIFQESPNALLRI
jgi:hypothetical protein